MEFSPFSPFVFEFSNNWFSNRENSFAPFFKQEGKFLSFCVIFFFGESKKKRKKRELEKRELEKKKKKKKKKKTQETINKKRWKKTGPLEGKEEALHLKWAIRNTAKLTNVMKMLLINLMLLNQIIDVLSL